ncbi:MAG: prepilin peptidase [Acidobacteriota bacterium]
MLLILFAFLGGLLIGSFLNVCIFRLPRDLSVASPSRSFCPNCVITAEEQGVEFEQALKQGTIAWYDNIPIVSYLLLRGRCRHCKIRIPIRYPLVELATGVAFALCVGTLGWTLAALKFCVFSAIMIDLIVTDFEEYILPDEFTLGGLLVGFVFAWFTPLPVDVAALFVALFSHPLDPHWTAPDPRIVSLLEALIGALIASLPLWALAWSYEKIRKREGMGFGDVKMAAMIGAFLGPKLVLMTLILGSVMGSVIGVLAVLFTKKKASTYEMPFGSFLGVAGLIVALWGPVIAVWYDKLGR